MPDSDRRPQPRLVALALGALASAALAWPAGASAETLPAGSRDPGFSGDGIATVDLDQARFADVQIYRSGPQAGKLLAVGSAVPDSTTELLMARFNPDGSLDSSFAGDGIRTGLIDGGRVQPSKVELDQAGRILVVAKVGPDLDDLIIRFNADGTLDDGGGAPTAGFGGCGCGYVWKPGVADIAVDRLGSDGGQILYAGTAQLSDRTEAIAGRITSGGDPLWEVGLAMDSSPDSPESGWNDSGTAVSEDADGNVVVAGLHDRDVGTNPFRADRRFGLVRLMPDGELDTSFADDGGVSRPVGSQTDFALANELALGDDGRFFISGYTSLPAAGLGSPPLVAFEADGQLDSGFGDSGTHWHSENGFFGDLALDGDGRVVVGGIVDYTETFLQNAGVVRLMPDGDPDPDFGTDGVARVVDDPDGGTDTTATGMDMDDAGIVIAGRFFGQAMVARFLSEETEIEGGGDGGADDGSGDQGDVAGGVAGGGDRLRVHRIFVPRRLGRLFRRGIKVVASCAVNCRIFVAVRLGDETANELGVPQIVLARGTRAARADQRVLIVARFRRRARRLLAFAGGGTFDIEVRGVDAEGQQFSTQRSFGVR